MVERRVGREGVEGEGRGGGGVRREEGAVREGACGVAQGQGSRQGVWVGAADGDVLARRDVVVEGAGYAVGEEG